MTTTTLAPPDAVTHLATTRDAARLAFSAEQERMILDTCAPGCNAPEFAVLMEIARTRRLNPLLKQIHFVKRWDSRLRREVWSHQASIDGLRAIAERTGEYDGSDEAEYAYDGDGKLRSARVRVWRKGRSHPFAALVFFPEYVQRTKEGAPTQFWTRMPHVMLAKCAEAAALRKAFPEDMSGMYVPEEMGKDAAESEPEASPNLPKLEAVPPAPSASHPVERVPNTDAGPVGAQAGNSPDPIPDEAASVLLAISVAATRQDLNRLGKEIHKFPTPELQAQAREAFNARSKELE